MRVTSSPSYDGHDAKYVTSGRIGDYDHFFDTSATDGYILVDLGNPAILLIMRYLQKKLGIFMRIR